MQKRRTQLLVAPSKNDQKQQHCTEFADKQISVVNRPRSQARQLQDKYQGASDNFQNKQSVSKTTQETNAYHATTFESYLNDRKLQEDQIKRKNEEFKDKKLLMQEQSIQQRPVAKWLTVDPDTQALGLSQQEIEKRAKSLNIVIRDILNQLYEQSQNQLRGGQGKRKQEDQAFVWQRTLETVNSLFYQLPQETQSLAKQMSILVLAAETSAVSSSANLQQAALVNIKCLLESDPTLLPQMLHDLIEAYTDTIRSLADKGVNLMKNPTKSQKSNQRQSEPIPDRFEVTNTNKKETSQQHLSMKTLFRSNTQVYFFTHCLLSIGQFTSCASAESLQDFCQLVTNMLIDKSLAADQRSGDQSAMHLVQLFTRDVSMLTHSVNLECPIAPKLFKNIALMVIHNLQPKDDQDTSDKSMFILMASDMLQNCQAAQVKSEQIQESDQCYCQGVKKGNQSIVKCLGCKRAIFHPSCVNQTGKTNFICASCQSNQKTILSELETFYLQYQSSYTDFSEAIGSIKLLKKDLERGDLDRENNNYEQSSEDSQSDSDDQDQCGAGNSVTFEVEYAKALLMRLHQQDVDDLAIGLKDTLILVACTAKTATQRTKSLKAISKMIKLNPASILDEKIRSLLYLRAQDFSVIARESALDMLQQYFRSQLKQTEENHDMAKFTSLYLKLIVEKASDKSHLVRRKVIQLLTSLLNNAKGTKESTTVLQVLLLKWHDSNHSVRENLVKCLGKILTQKLSKEGVAGALEVIKVLVSCTSMSQTQSSQQHDVWSQVFEVTEVRQSLAQNADELAQQTVLVFCQAETPQRRLEAVRLLLTLAPQIAEALLVTLQVLVPALECEKTKGGYQNELQLNTTIQRLLCEAILPIVEQAHSEDGLPVKQSEDLRQAAKRLLYSCPLDNLPIFVKLNESLDQLQLLQIVLQCVRMLQTDDLKTGKVSERVIGRALLIIAHGVSILPDEGLAMMEQNLGVQVETLVQKSYQAVFEAHFTSDQQDISQSLMQKAELFDVSLEGLSQIWLKYPNALSQSLRSSSSADNNGSSVFDLVKQGMLQQEGSSLKAETQARIIQTLTRFLSDMKEQHSEFICFMKSLLHLIDSRNCQLRSAACELYFVLYEHGHLQLSDSILTFIAMQVDTLKPIRLKSLSYIALIVRSKLHYFDSCLQPQAILEKCLARFSLIEDTSESCFVQTRTDSSDDVVEQDQGVFESIVTLLVDEDVRVAQGFIVRLLSLSESSEFISGSSYRLLAYYSQVLLSLAKPINNKVHGGKNNQASDKIALTCDTLTSTRQLSVYRALKTLCLAAQNTTENDAEQDDYLDCREESKISVQDIDQTVKEAFVMLSLKMFEKLYQSNTSKNSSKATTTNNLNQAQENTKKTQAAFYRAVNKQLQSLLEVDLVNGSKIDAAFTLKEKLKEILRQDDRAFQIKLEKRIQQIKTQPAMKKRIKRSSDGDCEVSGDDDLSADSDQYFRISKEDRRKTLPVRRQQKRRVRRTSSSASSNNSSQESGEFKE